MDQTWNDLIPDSIKFLRQKDSYSKKEKCLKTAKALRCKACEVGISAEDILSVCKLICYSKFDAAITKHLIMVLVPRESVPEDAVLMIIAKLCRKDLPITVMRLLFQWLVLVFDVIATKSRLHCLYGILFHFVEYECLAPFACQLLFQLTRKVDVTYFRIQRLTALEKQVGLLDHFCGLLSIYKMYQPAMISIPARNKAFFKNFNKGWKNSIETVQKRYGFLMADEHLMDMARLGVVTKVLKRNSLIPSPKPLMVHEPPNTGITLFDHSVDNKVQVYRIKTFQDVLDNIGRLDLNCQSACLLKPQYLHHIIAVNLTQSVGLRLGYWVKDALNREIWEKGCETERGQELLCILLQLTDLLQECLPVCQNFLFTYLSVWNGSDYRGLILSLISKLPITTSQVLHDFVISPVRKLCSFSDPDFKGSIVMTFSTLLSNYLNLKIPKLLEKQAEGLDDSKLWNTGSPFKNEGINAKQTIKTLIRFVADISEEGLRADKDNLFLLFQTLQFYAKVSRMFLDHHFALIILPDTWLFHKCIMSLYPFIVSSFCRLLINYRCSIEEMKQKKILYSSHQDMIDLINRYMLDTYDTLWRRRSFLPHANAQSILFSDLHADNMKHIDDCPINRMFSIDRHPAFVHLAKEYIDSEGRCVEEAFSGEFVFEDSYTKFMKKRGCDDVIELIRTLRSE